MTEQKLIEIAKDNWFDLKKVDKSLITQRVIDEIKVIANGFNVYAYSNILKGVKPEVFSKRKALEFLKYDKELYALLTKELQEDKEILEMTTCDIDRLPKCIFENKVAINYILDKWNVDGKSWAVYRPDAKCLTIKLNVNNNRNYVIYQNGILTRNGLIHTSDNFNNTKFNDIALETMMLSNELKLMPSIAAYIVHLD